MVDASDLRSHLVGSLVRVFDEIHQSQVHPPNERCLVGRLAIHLSQVLPLTSRVLLDIEYGRSEQNTKQLSPDGPRLEVDLVIHERNGPNYFAAEFKPSILKQLSSVEPGSQTSDSDRERIRALTGNPCGSGLATGPYQLGAVVTMFKLAEVADIEWWWPGTDTGAVERIEFPPPPCPHFTRHPPPAFPVDHEVLPQSTLTRAH